MSSVTTVVILSGSFKDFDEGIEKLNAWIREHYESGGLFEKIDRGTSAGTKYPQVEAIWGGFNYMYKEDFIEFFKKLNLFDTIAIFTPEDGEEFDIVKSQTKVNIL